MDEKKVREAICCIKSFTDDTVCEECDNYDRCDRTMVIDNTRTAIEVLEKQLPKKPIKTTEETGIRYTDSYRCPNCGGNFTGTGIADFCYHCGQRLDWSE